MTEQTPELEASKLRAVALQESIDGCAKKVASQAARIAELEQANAKLVQERDAALAKLRALTERYNLDINGDMQPLPPKYPW